MTLRGGELALPARGRCSRNVLLADEINRTPPKTQAALLEAMQERQVTVDGAPQPLPDPFLVRRDAEPDRVRGHLPAARGPARPLPRAGSTSATRRARRGARDARLAAPRRGAARRSTRSRPVRERRRSCARRAAQVDATTRRRRGRCGYVVALVRATRDAAERRARRQPARRRPPARRRAKAAAAARGPRLRHARRRRAHGAAGARATGCVLTPEAELERYRPDDADPRRARRGAGPAVSRASRVGGARSRPRVAAVTALLDRRPAARAPRRRPARRSCALAALMLPLGLVGRRGRRARRAAVDAVGRAARAAVDRRAPEVLSRGVAGAPARRRASGVGRRAPCAAPGRAARRRRRAARGRRRRSTPSVTAAAAGATRSRRRPRVRPGRCGSRRWDHAGGAPTEVRVFPDLPTARRLALAVARGRFREPGAAARGPLGLGTEFESIRDYQPDDDIRQVNWRATERHRAPDEQPVPARAGPRRRVLVDAGRLMARAARRPHAGSTPRSTPRPRSRWSPTSSATAAACGRVRPEVRRRAAAAPRRRGQASCARDCSTSSRAPSTATTSSRSGASGAAKRALVLVLTDLLERPRRDRSSRRCPCSPAATPSSSPRRTDPDVDALLAAAPPPPTARCRWSPPST